MGTAPPPSVHGGARRIKADREPCRSRSSAGRLRDPRCGGRSAPTAVWSGCPPARAVPPARHTRFDSSSPLAPPDTSPAAGRAVAAIAAREGATPDEWRTTNRLEDGRVSLLPGGELCDRRPRGRSARCSTFRCRLGLSDGGAHCPRSSMAGVPSYMLTDVAANAHPRPKLPLEVLVKRQTTDREFRGLTDRGRPSRPVSLRRERDRLLTASHASPS